MTARGCADGCADSECYDSSCETCLPVCYAAQTLCDLSGQAASNYGTLTWPKSFAVNDIIYKVLPRDVFNSAFSYMNSALHAGNPNYSGGITSSWIGTAETRDFIYRDKVCELLDGLSKFAGGHSIPDPPVNGVIYADYFTDIAEALHGATISSSACDECNDACDVTCNECQGCVDCEGCVECEGCDSCEGYGTCHSPCHSPCHTPCDTPEGGEGTGGST